MNGKSLMNVADGCPTLTCLRGDTGVKICEILYFIVFGIIIKIKLFSSM